MDQRLIIDLVLLYLHNMFFEATLFGATVFHLKLSQPAGQNKISLHLLFHHLSFYKTFNIETKQRKITHTKIKIYILTHRQFMG